jgi:luciferase family oxidoreductase group 1
LEHPFGLPVPAAASLPLSVLDLSPILRGSDAAQALRNTLDLAQHAERWGYRRFWLAEHHNMPGIASAATSVVIGHVAGGTSTIRVGSGGVMLPNHSPLVIAEQFGTLASLYPGRIDLGLGRAPGSDPRTTLALRRERTESADSFPRDVVELQRYFQPARPGQAVRAIPGEGLEVPIWLLGSSLFSAQLAAALGLPYAFAAHFAPDHLDRALEIYRDEFQPSPALAAPHAMVAVGVYAAASDREGARLFTSAQQQILNLRRGEPTPLNPPVDTMEGRWSSVEKAMVEHAQRETIVGAPETVRRGLAALVARTGADELIVAAQIFDHAARLRSYELVAGLHPAPAAAAAGG